MTPAKKLADKLRVKETKPTEDQFTKATESFLLTESEEAQSREAYEEGLKISQSEALIRQRNYLKSIGKYYE